MQSNFTRKLIFSLTLASAELSSSGLSFLSEKESYSRLWQLWFIKAKGSVLFYSDRQHKMESNKSTEKDNFQTVNCQEESN